MDVTVSKAPVKMRNPGPDWGYAFLRRADRWLPSIIFEPGLRVGAGIAAVVMREERRNSGNYLSLVLGRPATRREIWRHFFAFTRMFILRLRVAEGQPHFCRPLPTCEEFMALMASDRPALLGTFHFGNSDLLGFFLREFRREIFMIRLQMTNSADTDHLGARFAPWVKFIWVNQTENLLFALKQAAQSGASIALKCDRPEHSAKLEAFDFLGAKRLFPVTIYHLALLFRRPVVFCVSAPGDAQESLLHASPVFEPDGGEKTENLARAHVHFQSFLTSVETLLCANPMLWFNFTPLNPVAPAALPLDLSAQIPVRGRPVSVPC
jgi:predicted LPLAT superfamily acyltransferase